MPRCAGLRGLIRLSALLVAVSLTVEARAAGAPHKTTQSESCVAIDPIYSTILEGNKPRALLMVELGLAVPDGALRERVAQALPALRDTYVRSLLVYAASAGSAMAPAQRR
jgi:flagellar basal body-associated protein FliL